MKDGIPVLGVAQSRIFQCPAPRITVPAGRRVGKTTYAAVRLFRNAYLKPDSANGYFAPTYKMGKDIMWTSLKRIIPACYVAKTHETELKITLLNRSFIQIKGCDDPDKLRGPGWDDAVFDEYADIDPAAWSEVIEPALSDREGTAAFLGTPKGYNHFYDHYLLGLSGEHPDWASFSFTTAQGGRVKRSVIEKARATLDLRVFRQEYEASFETLSGRVYDNFSRAPWPKGNCDARIVDQGGPLVIGLDFNINPMSAVVFQDADGWPQVVEEIELFSSNTEEMAQVIQRKYPERAITIAPDASGQNRHTSSPLGQTDLTILRSHGFKILVKNSNPNPVDRINNVQSLLCSGTGLRRLTIHPGRCPKLVRALEGQTYDKGKVDKTLGLDHITDALGYGCYQRWNVLYNLLPRSAPAAGGMHSPFPVAFEAA